MHVPPLDSVNNHAPQPEPTPLQLAQSDLVAAAMGQGMRPESLVASAYANGLLQSARLTAVIKLLMQARLLPMEADGFDTVEAYLEHLTVQTINGDIIPRLKANAPSRIITGGPH